MICEKGFQFSFVGFIFLQLLYMNWCFIIQSNSHINHNFFIEICITRFDMLIHICPCIMITYLFIFFVLRIYTSLKKHNTSNTYNEMTVSILQSLNSCLQDIPVPAPHIIWITLFCSLNIGILSLPAPRKL